MGGGKHGQISSKFSIFDCRNGAKLENKTFIPEAYVRVFIPAGIYSLRTVSGVQDFVTEIEFNCSTFFQKKKKNQCTQCYGISHVVHDELMDCVISMMIIELVTPFCCITAEDFMRSF